MPQHIPHRSLLAIASHEKQRHDHQASWSVTAEVICTEWVIYLEFDYILADLFDNSGYIIPLIDSLRLWASKKIRILPILRVRAGYNDLDQDLVIVDLWGGNIDDLDRGTG